MAMQTPVLSISIQDMSLSDVICMSRHRNFIYHIMIAINFYVMICHTYVTYAALLYNIYIYY